MQRAPMAAHLVRVRDRVSKGRVRGRGRQTIRVYGRVGFRLG